MRFIYLIKRILKESDISIEISFLVVYIITILVLKGYVKILDNITTYIAILGLFTGATVWLRNYFETRPQIDIKLIENIPSDLPKKQWGLNFPFYGFDLLDNLIIFLPIMFINSSKQDNCIYRETYVFKMIEDEIPIEVRRIAYSVIKTLGIVDDYGLRDFDELKLPVVLKPFTAVKNGVALRVQREIINEYFTKEKLEERNEFEVEIMVAFNSVKGKTVIIRKKFKIKHKFDNNYRKISELFKEG